MINLREATVSDSPSMISDRFYVGFYVEGFEVDDLLKKTVARKFFRQNRWSLEPLWVFPSVITWSKNSEMTNSELQKQ